MADPILVDVSSSSEEDFYDNFEKMKAEKMRSNVKKNSQKITEIVPVKKAKDDNSSDSNLASKLDQDWNILSDDDELVKDNPSLMNQDQPRSSSADSIVIGSDTSDISKPPIIEIGLDNDPSPSVPVPDKTISAQNRSITTEKTCMVNIHLDGKVRMFIHDSDQPFKYLIEEFAERAGIDPKKVILIMKNSLKRCDPTDTPRTLGFEDGSSIDLDAFENIEENEVKTIRIKYQMKERKAVTVKVLPDVTFGRLREQFCNENNLDPAKVHFIFDSNRLKDDETPASIEMENDDAIDVYLDS